MASKLYEESYINAIAEAINSVTEASNQYTVGQMAPAVAGLVIRCTQAEYDAMPSHPDTSLYIIVKPST